MAYNIYVIASDILVSMLCGAVALLLSFQLRRDAKARIFLTFALFECLAEASLVVARIIGLLGKNDFQPFFYLGAIFYTCYPAIWLNSSLNTSTCGHRSSASLRASCLCCQL